VHRAEGVLGVPKRFENRANVFEAELDPEVFEAEKIFER
jgi:hypothetical protein